MHYASLQWQENGEPFSLQFGDVYFRSGMGEAESHHVFIAGNKLASRFAECNHFTLVETGFGTGLNFLITVALWQRTAPAGAVLH